MPELDDAEIAGRLLHHLARAFDCPDAAYLAGPARIQGGFDTTIFGFTLDRVPPPLHEPLILRLSPAGADPARVKLETIGQNTLAGMGYTPTLRSVAEETGQRGAPPEEVFVHIFPGVVKPTASRAWINGVLFLATIWSTLLVGATNVVEPQAWTELISPSYLLNGLPFSATLLAILLAHEFGHYFAARFHRVAVTLPYFIPMPVGFGTFGAFIRLKEPISDRRKLFDIGVAGPLADAVGGGCAGFGGRCWMVVLAQHSGARSGCTGTTFAAHPASQCACGPPVAGRSGCYLDGARSRGSCARRRHCA